MLAPVSSTSTLPAKSSQWLDVDAGGAGDDLDGSGEGWWRYCWHQAGLS